MITKRILCRLRCVHLSSVASTGIPETDEDNSTMCAIAFCQNCGVREDVRKKTVGGIVVVDFHWRCAGSGETAVDGFPRLPTVLESVSRKFRPTALAGPRPLREVPQRHISRIIFHANIRGHETPPTRTVKLYRSNVSVVRVDNFSIFYLSPLAMNPSRNTVGPRRRATYAFPVCSCRSPQITQRQLQLDIPPSFPLCWLARELYRNTIGKLPENRFNRNSNAISFLLVYNDEKCVVRNLKISFNLENVNLCSHS